MRLLGISAVVLIIGFTWCQELQNIPELQNLTYKAEELQNAIRDKCFGNGASEEAVSIILNQPFELNTCLESQLNFTQIQQEIEDSKKNSTLDEVVKKYCRKYPQIYDCIESVTESLKPCLNSTEHEVLNKTLELVGTLEGNLCYKDGSRIALFISQGGMECVDSKQEEIQNCFNSTMADRVPVDMSIGTLSDLFVLNDKKCNDLLKIRFCFYEVLTKCDKGIPANVIDAFFKFLKKELSCNDTSNYFSNKVKHDDSLIRVIIIVIVLVGVVLISYKLAT